MPQQIESQTTFAATDVEMLAWAAIRAKRNRLLAETDYTQLPDSPMTQEQKVEIAIYRQQLRDLPQKYPMPATVVWPVRPV